MATQPRVGDRPTLPIPCPREGAVLILLCEHAGSFVIPLTYRSQTVGLHKGQISLPGGGREPQDASFEDTALRETREELGIPESCIETLGRLTPLYIPASAYCVYPIVGHTRQSVTVSPNPREVAAVIAAPLESLLDETACRSEVRQRESGPYLVPFYQIAGHQIWGATAMILAEFLALLRTVPQPMERLDAQE